jgi:hypothetical protein
LNPFVYTPFTAEVGDAIERLERATAFDRAAYDVARREARRRGFVLGPLMIATWLLGALALWATTGWTLDAAPWAYAFGPFFFVVLLMTLIRRKSAADEQRLGRALGKWRRAAQGVTTGDAA